jgi:pyruvate dehydrogenase (quinone)
MHAHLVGDAKLTLGALVPYLERKTDRRWEQRVAKGVSDWWRLMADRAQLAANPMNPQRVFWELSPRLPERAVLCADSGSAANWFARDLKLRRGMKATLSGSLATMGCGVPYAIGAKFAHPDRPVFALVGDGAMQMNGMNELLTIHRYWREWPDARVVVLVLHNNDLNQVTWEMRAMAGDTRYVASQELPDFAYARYAELVGLRGIRVDRPDDLAAAWDQALSSPMPVVIEAVVDPDVPPFPPHITLQQMQSFGMSLLKGDTGRGGVVRQALSQLFPGVGKKG